VPAVNSNEQLNSSADKKSSNDHQNNTKQNTTTVSEISKPTKEKIETANVTTVMRGNSVQTKKSLAVRHDKQSARNKTANSFVGSVAVKPANKTSKNKTSVNAETKQPANTGEEKNQTPAKKITDSASSKKAAAAVVVANANKTPAVENKDNLVKDNSTSPNSVTAVAPMRHHQSKWQIGFSAGAGSSALTDGLTLGSLFDRPQSLSYDAIQSTTVPVPYVRGYVTAVKGQERKSTSFSFGFLIRKLVGKKLNFSSGLNYAYYSTIIDRGNVTPSSFSTNVGSGTVTNGGGNFSNGGNGSFYNYVNQFHFLGLPVAVDIRPVRKLPVHVRGGISVQQLVSTNALVFDQMSKAYTYNSDAYQKTQIFSELGLNYSVRRKNAQMLIGPQFSYGITKMEKVYPSRHLFSFGLNAQFLFSKK
jgi:hypothetical protein